jgi:hypothetical protein
MGTAMASGGAFACVGEASLVLAVLAPLPTLLFATPFFWWAGRLWGPKATATLGVVYQIHPSANVAPVFDRRQPRNRSGDEHDR